MSGHPCNHNDLGSCYECKTDLNLSNGTAFIGHRDGQSHLSCADCKDVLWDPMVSEFCASCVAEEVEGDMIDRHLTNEVVQ